MKKYIFYNAFVLALLMYYLFSSGFIDKVFVKDNAPFTPTVQNAPYPKEFINCIFNMAYYGRPNTGCYANQRLSVENHLQRYKNELNFNSLHIYSGASAFNGGNSCGGSFEEPIVNYDDEYFIPLRNSVSSAGIKGIYGRAKIEMPCYFQCVEYEVKPSGGNPSDYNYGFCFNYTMPNVNVDIDNGRTVLHAPAGTSGYLCKDIYENLQHSDIFAWNWNDSCYWKIRPMMRIDSNYVDQHPDSNVIRIDIIKFNGELLKSVDIKAKDFARSRNSQTLEYIYNGNYIDSINFSYEEVEPKPDLRFNGGRYSGGLNHGWNNNCQNWNTTNHVDFRIYAYGNTDVWFDKLTVEDEYAERMFHGDYDNYYIKAEVNAFTNDDLFSYFADEITYSCIKSIKYVKDKIREENQSARFYFAMTNYFGIIGMRTDTMYYQAMTDIINPECFCTDAHQVLGPVPPVYNTNVNIQIPDYWQSDNYDDYNLFVQNQLLGDKNAISSTEDYYWHAYHIPTSTGSLIYQTNLARRFANKCSPKSYLFVQPQIQSNMVKSTDGTYDWNREPTNEEIRVQACCALAHGADGLSWFIYQSLSFPFNSTSNEIAYSIKNIYGPGDNVDSLINVGMLELNSSGRRYLNYYNQDKWDSVAKMNQVFLNWKPTLDNINWTEGYSVHSEGPNHNIITDIRSKINDQNIYSNCTQDGGYYDCPNDRYWEMGFFQSSSTSDKNKYVLMVNRRCNPKPPSNIGGESPDVRTLYIKFNNDEFPVFNSWDIIDVNTGLTITSYDKKASSYLNIGSFQPGEGKLLKISPVIPNGGTLVSDESINSSITISKNVYSGGHNITIGPNANITFSDSAGIYMSGGGVLKIGNENQTYGTGLQMQGVSGGSSKWQGFNLDGLDTVLIYGATFSNILPNQPAINMTNCYHFKIEGCQFNCAENDNTAGIYADYNEVPYLIGDSIFQHIGGNSFNFNNSSNNIIQVVSTASPEIPIIIEDNQINVGPEIVTTSGIFLSNITGGVIKNNEIRNCLNGIVLVSSNCDFFENIISSNYENSIAISLKIGEGEMGPSNGYFVGGYNDISTLRPGSKNIDVGDSYFDIVNGYNSFDIDYNQSPYHIAGYFPSSAYLYYKAGYNCFKNNHTQDTACINVTQGYQGSPITLDPIPYYCQGMNLQDFIVFSLPGNLRDTIYYTTSGNGGSYNEGQARAVTVDSSYKSLKDSININTRKRNYNLLEIECKEMLSQFPDSSVSIPAVSKLYLSSLSIDNQGNHISTTKTFLENLILNNPNNVPLIKKANYFIQKCKVSLHQYASALQGFQEIMNQNPYSYEGLIASWDYAATTLLMGSGSFNDQLRVPSGSMLDVKLEDEAKEQSEKEIKDLSLFTSAFSLSIEALIDTLKNRKTNINSYLSSDYDKSRFTKKDREVIKVNVENAFQKERNKQINKLTELEKKITKLSKNSSPTINNNSSTIAKNKSDVKSKIEYELKEAKKELKVVKALSDVVMTKRPKSVIEHKKTVSQEIKKVFGVEKLPLSPKTNTNTPTEYKLSQNYPNPFNPVTKINYDLPKDAKVKLVIYNILGQEMKVLVNNEFKQAGRYMVEFNGSYFASGIYFYRILVDEGKNYSAVKKMVLVK